MAEQKARQTDPSRISRSDVRTKLLHINFYDDKQIGTHLMVIMVRRQMQNAVFSTFFKRLLLPLLLSGSLEIRPILSRYSSVLSFNIKIVWPEFIAMCHAASILPYTMEYKNIILLKTGTSLFMLS